MFTDPSFHQERRKKQIYHNKSEDADGFRLPIRYRQSHAGYDPKEGLLPILLLKFVELGVLEKDGGRAHYSRHQARNPVQKSAFQQVGLYECRQRISHEFCCGRNFPFLFIVLCRQGGVLLRLESEPPDRFARRRGGEDDHGRQRG